LRGAFAFVSKIVANRRMTRLPCPAELWPAFSTLLDQALELSEGERPRWLASLGAEHAAVRPWLAKVLASNPGTLDTDFMQSLVVSDPEPPEFSVGQQIGPYRLIRRLGTGGMGEVWLASRTDGTLNREVALKLPHTHLLAGVIRRRFERERDILAALSHPNIAQLYDAGVAAGQHPYLAMECVDGLSINEHCHEAKLSLDRRLDLFLQVLDAVGYAHGRLIAHRDLKPSNILVTRDERVKLLDFGIAKLLSSEADVNMTQLTHMGTAMATPGYAAPEQLAGEPITVAVDLYALGVILHELLTGQRPFRTVRKTAQQPTDAPRASSRIESGHAASIGGMDSRQLRRALSGDLDAIIAKALESDPLRRYGTAQAFALDIRLSREHRPISARRIGPKTVTLKFVRRHRLGVSMGVMLLLLFIGGSAGIGWYAVRAEHEAQRAEREARRAEREAQRATSIKDFLVGMFRASDPRIAADKPRGEITARDLLDVSAKQIETGFAEHPDTEIELLGVTADIYRELDETQRSTALYARETEVAANYQGAADAHAIDGLLGQANNADKDGDDVRALQLLAKVDPLIRQAHLDRSAVRAHWLLMRGEALFGDAAHGDEAQSSLEAAAALFKAVAPRDPRYPDALTDLGSLSLERHRYSRSAAFFRQAIDIAQQNPQLEGDLLLAYEGLALALSRLADFAGAAAGFEHGAEIAERTYGRDTQQYWAIASDWAQFRYERGERQTALAAFETLLQGLPGDRAAYRNATDAQQAMQALRKYGYCLAIDGQGARAVEILTQAHGLLKQAAPRAFDAGRLQLDLGTAYAAAGRIAAAREAFSSALAMWRSQAAPESKLALALGRWGRFLLSQKDANGAEVAFNEILHISGGRADESAILAQAGLAGVAIDRRDARVAMEASGRALEQLGHIEGYYDIRIQPYVWGLRSKALLLAGDEEGARAFANRTRDAASRYYAPGTAAVAAADDWKKNLPRRAALK
jgi:serine/threonine-protein kinase